MPVITFYALITHCCVVNVICTDMIVDQQKN